jgi:hypothetical protein
VPINRPNCIFIYIDLSRLPWCENKSAHKKYVICTDNNMPQLRGVKRFDNVVNIHSNKGGCNTRASDPLVF